MQFVSKLEKMVLGWAKNIPHLSVTARKWLGDNVWWIVLVGVIFSAIAALVGIDALLNLLSVLASVSGMYYVTGLYTGIDVLQSVVAIVFLVVSGLILALAVKPLQAKQKKGWNLLFIGLLINAVSALVSAVLSFSVFGFIGGILFGAIFIAIGAYFVTEIHGQFEHRLKAKIKKA